MRCGKQALAQATRNGFTHLRNRHFIKTNLTCKGRCGCFGCSRLCNSGGRWCRCSRAITINIGFGNPSIITGAFYIPQINAFIRCNFFSQWRCEYSSIIYYRSRNSNRRRCSWGRGTTCRCWFCNCCRFFCMATAFYSSNNGIHIQSLFTNNTKQVVYLNIFTSFGTLV